MTRIFTDGAEMGDMLFWDVAETATNTTTLPRSGSRHYTIGSGVTVSKSFTGVAEGYWRLGWLMTAIGAHQPFFWRNSSTSLGSIRINGTTGCVEIYTGTGTLVATSVSALKVNTWYNLEVHLKIDDSAGAIDVRVDGDTTSFVAYSGDTKPGTATTIDNAGTVSAGGVVSQYLDDLAMNDTAGVVDNSWCGDGKIVMLSPTAAGDVTQLTASAGSNWQCVDEVPPNTTDYVSSATAGQYDLYNCGSATLNTGETVRRVFVEARSLEEVAAGDSIALGVKTQSVENFGSNQVVGNSYARYVGTDYATNPASGVAWTQADLDAIQVGVKVI